VILSSVVELVPNSNTGVVDPSSELEGIWYARGSIRKSNYIVTSHDKRRYTVVRCSSLLGEINDAKWEALRSWQVRIYRVKVCATWQRHTRKYSAFCLWGGWRQRVCQPHRSWSSTGTRSLLHVEIINSSVVTRDTVLTTCKSKGKVFPSQARCGPEGGQRYSSSLPWPPH